MGQASTKNWTAAEAEEFIDYYCLQRTNGMGRVAARIKAQNHSVAPSRRYNDSTVKTLGVNDGVLAIFTRAEEVFQDRLKVIADEIQRPPAVSGFYHVKPQDQTQPTPWVPPVEPADDEDEKPTFETYLILAARTLRDEILEEQNLKLNKLLDLMTSPDITKAEIENEIFELIQVKEKLPKLVICGLLGAQVHIVNAAVGHKFKIKHFTADKATEARDAVRQADLTVTMANFIGHDTENMLIKYIKEGANWFSHHGGIKVLIDKLLKHSV